MKEKLSKVYQIYKSFTPPAFQKPCLSAAYQVLDMVYKPEYLKFNSKLKNVVDESREAFVLATGPSLKHKNLNILSNKDCFSVSNFFLHPQLETVRPKFHFFAPYHKPLILSNFVAWLHQADRTLPKETQICLSLRDKKIIEKHNLFLNRKVIYLRFGKASSFSGINPCNTLLAPYTSPIMILPLLLYMGYKKVFLLGCDSNSLRDYGGKIQNFYSNNEDPRINATSNAKWDSGIIKEMSEQLEQMKQYHYYNNLYTKLGRKLYNCSESSWLDFIEFYPFESLVSSQSS